MRISELHKKTDIPYTTLATWKKRGAVPKEKAPYVCGLLGIPVTENFDEILSASNDNGDDVGGDVA